MSRVPPPQDSDEDGTTVDLSRRSQWNEADFGSPLAAGGPNSSGKFVLDLLWVEDVISHFRSSEVLNIPIRWRCPTIGI